ncbi:MAG: hypothetical protein ACJ0FX_00820 [Gammaproteobacteria bacterium]|tara:strand:- start:753 stop:962 length:210 start_codon:yes stop_codon:yes gene_type:complete
MNNIKKINKFDPVIERFISSHDKSSIKKTLAFEYFNNDIDALNTYINKYTFNSKSLNFIEPKAQLEFSF